ncbi:FRAS1-related extracellular matrix protein 2-like [Amphiura filiformis]|uniref:FRAS1-related extracellular matrix protein 2-like n=1 Tax=Amphiura filiformis TaxID=82378 RepID=UPI003B225284
MITNGCKYSRKMDGRYLVFQLFLCVFVSFFSRSVSQSFKCTDLCAPTDLVGLVYGFMQCAGTTFQITETTGADIDFNFCLCKGPPNPSGAKFDVTITHTGGANPTEAADFDEGVDPIVIPISNLGGNGARCTDNTITILGDSLAEDTETFTLTLTFENCEDNDMNPCTFDPGFNTITVDIVDDDSTPPVENKACDCATQTWYILDRASYFVTEPSTGTRMLQIGIIRKGVNNHALGSVDLTVVALSATGTADYVNFGTETINFAANEFTMTHDITINSDDLFEGTEDFLLFLSNPGPDVVAAGVTETLGDLTSAVVSIYDEDTIDTWYYLGCAEYTVTESDTMIDIVVKRRGDTSSATSGFVELSTTDITALSTSDYTALTSEAVDFAADATSSTPITLTITNDMSEEPLEHLEIALTLTAIADASALADLTKAFVTIIDDDSKVTWYSLDCGFYTATETDAGNVMITITITKRGDLSQGTTVLLSTMDITATGGTALDYTIKTNEIITFTADTETVETSQLVILSDDITEGNEYLQVALSLPSTPPAGDALSDVNKALVIIYDDDEPECDGGNGCDNNGICVATDVCVCASGFTGNLCQFGSPSPVCDSGNGCANNGLCVATDVCVCASGFTGNLCQFGSASPVCDGGNGCANNGLCVATDVCVCASGFTGNFCQFGSSSPVCDSGNGCANNGLCVATDVCVCASGFTGNLCQFGSASPVCDGGNGCANNGLCVATDVCVCASGFTGNLCQFGSASPGKLQYS